MQPTRLQILQILKHEGQATVEGLATQLGITLMAVRLHLVVLERDSMVTRSSLRSGPGRPTLLYRLTAEAEDVFPKDYDRLAAELLGVVRRQGGPQAVEALCREAAPGLAEGLRVQVGSGDLARRMSGYVRTMSDRGHLVQSEEAENGFFLSAYTCPFYRVARQHREVCVLHRNMLRELFGAEVEMVTCQLDGDRRCSHLVRVPAAAPVAGEPSEEGNKVSVL